MSVKPPRNILLRDLDLEYLTLLTTCVPSGWFSERDERRGGGSRWVVGGWEYRCDRKK